MSPYKRNLVTGIVVLGALGVLVWMILTFSGRAMGIFKARGTPVVFLSERGDGLSDGSPVLFKGVQVGKVTGVRRSSDNVHVSIDGEIENVPPLPGNLVGDIKAQSYLGVASQIELRLEGNPDGQLTQGSEIKIRYTGNSIVPPEVTDLVEQIHRQQMVVHMDQTIVSLHAQIEKFGIVMDSVQKVIGNDKFREDIAESLASVRRVTDRADKIGMDLEVLTKNATATMGDVRTTVAKTSESMDRLTLQMGSDLDKLGVVFHQFQNVAEKINNGKGTAGALVNDPKLYDEMAMTAKELNVVAQSLSRLVDQWEHEGVAIKLAK